MRKTNITLKLFRKMAALMLSFCAFASHAQFNTPTDSIPGDPGGVYVYTMQNLAFGAFYHGASGGTVVIGTDGSRSVTGDVVALNLGISYFNAIFEIEGRPGTIVTIMNGPNATLTGSNGGSMTLSIGSSQPGSPITTTVSPPSRTSVSIGGTLTVGGAPSAPPGTYSGTFYVTFSYE